MYYKHAPKTSRNFVELARRGYYDNVIFHRVIKVSFLFFSFFFSFGSSTFPL
jgi:cyclophilin family peptidyl-prolyl cis-trans isomerase